MIQKNEFTTRNIIFFLLALTIFLGLLAFTPADADEPDYQCVDRVFWHRAQITIFCNEIAAIRDTVDNVIYKPTNMSREIITLQQKIWGQKDYRPTVEWIPGQVRICWDWEPIGEVRE